MKKVFLFSLFLVLGLVLSQCLPVWLGEAFLTAEKVAKTLMFVCLAFIMINVGREFELDKTKWRSYAADYFIAMATAAVPWIMVAFYYMFLLPADLFGNWDAWKENLLLSRFAAPTSAGILFTMLAAAGLRREWIYKKTQVLAIFDDLDTILLMIPLQIFMIGFKWQLFAVVIVITFLLVIGWKKLGTIRLSQTWKSILFYAVCIVAVTESIYLLTKWNPFLKKLSIRIMRSLSWRITAVPTRSSVTTGSFLKTRGSICSAGKKNSIILPSIILACAMQRGIICFS